MIEEIDTGAVYGKQVAAALASIKSIDLSDPTAAMHIITDQAMDIAAAVGATVDMSAAGPIAGMMGQVIDHVASGISIWMDGQKTKSDEARNEQQRAIMTEIEKRYPRGAWSVHLSVNDLPGDGGYYWKRDAIGLAGKVTKELLPALPLASKTGRGFLQQGSGSGAGRSAAGEWRFWPGLFPVIYNTNTLTLQVKSIHDDDARGKMLGLCAQVFDPLSNLLIDGREVAQTLNTLKTWAGPLFKADISSDEPIRASSPNNRLPDRPGASNTYEQRDGSLIVYGPSAPVVRWIQTPDGVMSMEPDAYNHVLKTCARFFAYREHLLRRAWTWDATQRDTAAKSDEPSVRAALKLKPPPTPRGRPAAPSTKPAPGPTAHKLQPTMHVGKVNAGPVRVGRLPTWPTIAEVEDLIELTEDDAS